MTEKLEYDSALGGTVNVPDTIRTFHFAAERLNEIKILLKDVQNPLNNKLVFQSLPKHMRRRAMSHHPKRLPRHFRNIHRGQMTKAGNPKTTKRPSRKYRRKASNLMKEYIRRQRKNIWLETHIWHAKRFRMIPKWGYKLPQYSCNKMFRACYRATTKHCLIHDISYFGCLELKGTIEKIKTGFNRLTSANELSIAAKTYVSGRREGKISLFKADNYPKGALCTVTFLWKPEINALNQQRTLWLFVHPSAYHEVLKEIVSIFQLMPILPTEKQKEIQEESTLSNILKNVESNTILTELKDSLNRFRLTGPLSHAVLQQALKCKKIDEIDSSNWFHTFVSSANNADVHCKQEKFWQQSKGISSSSALMPNMVMGLNSEDPRINRPNKRTKAKTEPHNIPKAFKIEIPQELCISAIWDPKIRSSVSEIKMSDYEFCSLRSSNALVPGGRCNFEDELQPIPVLLVQRPGSQDCNKRLGYGSGWDVIVPSGYGTTVWLSLIMWGAKPGGLREMKLIYSEMGEEEFFPDTISGRKESEERYAALRKKYFLTPPSKRCNFQKLAITSPFKCCFHQLIRDWDESYSNDKDFYVLRDKKILVNIENALKGRCKLPSLPSECILPIHIKMKSRGNPGDFSIICLPNHQDIKRNLLKRKFLNNEPVHVEPVQSDKAEKDRKTLKIEHKRQLKRLRGKRFRQKRSQIFDHFSRIKESKALVISHLRKMQELWLPGSIEVVRNQCSREVFGFVTQSRFSFTEASVTAIGFITPPGLQKLMKICGKGEMVVLVRGTKSRNYRFATFNLY